MSTLRRFKADKLIRNKMPEIMREWGINIFERKMEQDEYIARLKDKLIEEAKEVISAKEKHEICEELADLIEVIHSLIAVNHLSLEQVEEARLNKKAKKGGFDGKIYTPFAELSSDHEFISYYLDRPKDYPEIK